MPQRTHEIWHAQIKAARSAMSKLRCEYDPDIGMYERFDLRQPVVNTGQRNYPSEIDDQQCSHRLEGAR